MTDPIRLDTDLTLTRTVVGPLSNNAYLLTTGAGEALLVDAAAEAEALVALVGDRRVTTIVTTHQHHDHIGALAELADATGARLVAGEPDVSAIMQQADVSPEGLWTGDTLTLGRHTIDVIGLVGHTPGSITLVVRPQGSPVQLFTGDSLFPGGVGKTGSTAAFTSLIDDVTRELFGRFDDDTVVWPGHGEATTLGAERPHLDEWRARGW